MSHSELLKRITVRPDVFGGKQIVREADDVRACIAWAHAVIAGDGRTGAVS